MTSIFEDYSEALDNATQAVIELRERAEEIRNMMESIIESCETIEGEL